MAVTLLFKCKKCGRIMVQDMYPDMEHLCPTCDPRPRNVWSKSSWKFYNYGGQ